MDHAARVCYAADKYELLPLKRRYAEYIYPRSIDEIWLALECSFLHNIDFLKDGAMKLVRLNTYEVLLSRQFTSLSRNALMMIVQEDDLNINSENELFDAVLLWAKHQCSIAGKTFDRKNFRDTVGDMIKHIRFLTMNEMDVIKYGKSVFTAEEIKLLLKCMKDKSDNQVSEFSCCSTEKRKKLLNFPVELPPAVVHSLKFNEGNEKYIVSSNKIQSQSLTFSTPAAINLHTVFIPTRTSLHAYSDRFYFEEVKATLKNVYNNTTVASGEFIGKVDYDTELHIPLRTPAGKFPKLSYSNSAVGYKLSLTFKAEEDHYYPLRMCSLSSVFTNTPNTISFLIGFDYSLQKN